MPPPKDWIKYPLNIPPFDFNAYHHPTNYHPLIISRLKNPKWTAKITIFCFYTPLIVCGLLWDLQGRNEVFGWGQNQWGHGWHRFQERFHLPATGLHGGDSAGHSIQMLQKTQNEQKLNQDDESNSNWNASHSDFDPNSFYSSLCYSSYLWIPFLLNYLAYTYLQKQGPGFLKRNTANDWIQYQKGKRLMESQNLNEIQDQQQNETPVSWSNVSVNLIDIDNHNQDSDQKRDEVFGDSEPGQVMVSLTSPTALAGLVSTSLDSSNCGGHGSNCDSNHTNGNLNLNESSEQSSECPKQKQLTSSSNSGLKSVRNQKHNVSNDSDYGIEMTQMSSDSKTRQRSADVSEKDKIDSKVLEYYKDYPWMISHEGYVREQDLTPQELYAPIIEIPSTESTQTSHSSGQSSGYKIPLRHCPLCDIFQPLRTKHCKYCNRCIPLHDHHCPWTGMCIGERNRGRFLIYVFFQFIFVFRLGVVFMLTLWSENEEVSYSWEKQQMEGSYQYQQSQNSVVQDMSQQGNHENNSSPIQLLNNNVPLQTQSLQKIPPQYEYNHNDLDHHEQVQPKRIPLSSLPYLKLFQLSIYAIFNGLFFQPQYFYYALFFNFLFILMLLGLLFLHSTFCISNFTTWEQMSWKGIQYLGAENPDAKKSLLDDVVRNRNPPEDGQGRCEQCGRDLTGVNNDDRGSNANKKSTQQQSQCIQSQTTLETIKEESESYDNDVQNVYQSESLDTEPIKGFKKRTINFKTSFESKTSGLGSGLSGNQKNAGCVACRKPLRILPPIRSNLYLKPRKYSTLQGSPFSRGCLLNSLVFFCPTRNITKSLLSRKGAIENPDIAGPTSCSRECLELTRAEKEEKENESEAECDNDNLNNETESGSEFDHFLFWTMTGKPHIPGLIKCMYCSGDCGMRDLVACGRGNVF